MAATATATAGVAHVRSLTGVRFFAALWVVAYHSTRHNADLIARHHPDALYAVQPLTLAGTRGVDLFFVLSGFVLALNYADRLGERLRLRPTLRFLWLRLARIWPLYLVVISGAGLLRLARHHLWDSASIDLLTVGSFLRQAAMVQQWFPPEQGKANWVGPAWSLSAEWLAYLLFPLLVLLVARVRTWGPAALMALTAVTMVPLLVGIGVRGNMTDWVWLPRILCQFTAGMLLATAVTRMSPTERVRRAAGWGAVTTVLAVLAWLYLPRVVALPESWTFHVVVLFLPLVVFLAIGTGPVVSLLSSRVLVLGGGLSYALYLVHSPLLYLFRDLTQYTSVLYLDPRPRYYAELAFVPVIVLVAWALFHFVEEPARRAMRRLIDERTIWVADAEPHQDAAGATGPDGGSGSRTPQGAPTGGGDPSS